MHLVIPLMPLLFVSGHIGLRATCDKWYIYIFTHVNRTLNKLDAIIIKNQQKQLVTKTPKNKTKTTNIYASYVEGKMTYDSMSELKTKSVYSHLPTTSVGATRQMRCRRQ